jgi:hypothetical protein
MTRKVYENLVNNIRCSTYHMNDKQAKEVIDKYLKSFPELLDFHPAEWYYKYC